MKLIVESLKELYYKIKYAKLPLEQTIFFLISIASIFMAIVGIAGNALLGLGGFTILIPAVSIILNIVCVTYASKTRKWVIPAILVVLFGVFLLLPFLWFSTGGSAGSTMPYIILAGFVIVIIFQGKIRNFLLATTAILFSIFIFLEMLNPDIYIPYPSHQSQYIDLIIGLITSFTVTATLAIVVLSRYRKAKLESEELVKKLGEISVTDPLTGIYNRRMLTSCLDEEMRKCYEDNSALTICLIDIDHFKNVNDVYGHLCGDEILVKLSNLLEKNIGPNDLLGRYGGEEFLLVLKNQSLDTALKTVERCHKAIQTNIWGNVAKITVSCGVSSYIKGISYSDFVRSADMNLYEAKRTGRDKVVYK